MAPVKTLVIVASEGKSRFLANEGAGKGLQEIASLERGSDEEFRYADDKGRSAAAPGTARHAFEGHHSERELARLSFAKRTLAEAEKLWVAGGYDRLAMAAPPKFLGLLREGMGSQMAAALAVDMDKDIVAETERELAAHFADKIVF